MWERIKSLFAPEDNGADKNLIRERLNRRGPRSGPQVEKVVELLQSGGGSERVRPHLPMTINYVDEHVRRSMNTSESLMQPGSAEAFQLIRLHPADELKARRERESQLSQSGRFLHKAVKAQRIA